jgi:hypothetical protein
MKSEGIKLENSMFDLNGHSPLVDYFLYKNAFNKQSTYENLLTHSQITSMPSADAPTYRDVIINSLGITKKLKNDYTM